MSPACRSVLGYPMLGNHTSRSQTCGSVEKLWCTGNGVSAPRIAWSVVVQGSRRTQPYDPLPSASKLTKRVHKRIRITHLNMPLDGWASSVPDATAIFTDALLLHSCDPVGYPTSSQAFLHSKDYAIKLRAGGSSKQTRHTVEETVDSTSSLSVQQRPLEPDKCSQIHIQKSAVQVACGVVSPADTLDDRVRQLFLRIPQNVLNRLVSMGMNLEAKHQQQRPSTASKITALTVPAHKLFTASSRILRPLPTLKMPTLPKVRLSLQVSKDAGPHRNGHGSNDQDDTSGQQGARHGSTGDKRVGTNYRYRSTRHKLMTVGLATGSTVLALGCAVMAMVASLVAASLLVSLFVSKFVPAASRALPGLRSAASTLIKAGTAAASFVAEMWRLLANDINDCGSGNNNFTTPA